MTAYLNATELVFPGGLTITPTSTPYNLGAVGSVIFEISAEVDGFAAAAGYEVPIAASAAEAYATVRRAVANGAQAVILTTVFPGQQDAGGNAPTLASTYIAAYKRFRDGLKSGDLILVGAAKAGEDQGRVLPRGGGLASAQITSCTQF